MLEIALFGKPNSGKSSFFKAATMIDVPIASHPFTTIKPNTGICSVIVDCVCEELGTKCDPKSGKCDQGKRFIPVKLWDVAGLVPDAHLGKGMGTAFLDDVRQAAALIHIVDASGQTDAEGKPTTGYDPAKDVETLESEIDLWFASVIERAISRYKRDIANAKMKRPELVQLLTEKLSGLEVNKQQIEEALGQASIDDVKRFAKILRKISKPILIAANKIDLKSAQENFEKLKEKYENVIPTSAEAEIALKTAAEGGFVKYLPGNGLEIKSALNEKQKKAIDFIQKNVIDKYDSTGIQDCLNKIVFDILNYIAVYPVADSNKFSDKDDRVLPDVFLVPTGTTVKELAFKVHSDIGEDFICGIDARTKRRLAADRELKNGDVVEIMFAK